MVNSKLLPFVFYLVSFCFWCRGFDALLGIVKTILLVIWVIFHWKISFSPKWMQIWKKITVFIVKHSEKQKRYESCNLNNENQWAPKMKITRSIWTILNVHFWIMVYKYTGKETASIGKKIVLWPELCGI